MFRAIDFFFHASPFSLDLINSNRGLFLSLGGSTSNLRKSALISLTIGMFIKFARGRNNRKRQTKLAGTYVAGATGEKKNSLADR